MGATTTFFKGSNHDFQENMYRKCENSKLNEEQINTNQ